ncbi:TonB-dependent receptor [Psychrosphaera ytuae]|uniref:TonB-dependent receptor n=1 Tax=Psychrosphaera ytuae TaxID=2820710 RepID=A0A975DD80_9GAMM|nr:TonB-dependent receptor [Psychrosphaera ytuae]QTH64773.1 TonB-dependent receptor [Psychrosphaera ytuae]
MFKNNKLANSVRLAIAFGAAATALPATSAFAAEEEAKEIEKIEVTGSRIKRTDIETATPVTITSAEDIKLSGYTKVEDILNSLPQIQASQTSFISNGASGTANINLRGMGTNRTLVLINGRRMGPGGLNSQNADINQIPAALVKRAEVMTGGGSSVYGADAVAGVVNFVMNDDFEGFEITAGASGYQHNNDNDYIQGLMDKRGFEYPTGNSGIDGKQFNLDLTMGGEFANGKGHAVVYATYRDIEELRQEARDYSSCALNSAGTACGGSGNAIIPNFYVGVPGLDDDGQPTIDWNGFSNYYTLTPESGFQASSGNVYNYAPVNHFMRPDKKYSLGAFIDYEINDHARPYMEISMMNDVTRAQIAESGTFFNEAYMIDYDSPLLSDAQRSFLTTELGLESGDEFATYIGKRNVEGGPRSSNLEHSSFRIVVGSEGEINDTWSYDASYQFASVTSSSVYINDFFAPRITTALSANGESCADTSGCVPYEVFTYQGVTPEQANTLTGVGIRKGYAKETIFNAFVSGEFDITVPTADMPVAAVFGVERRDQYFESISDEVFEKGLLLGQGGPTATLIGGYDVSEIFTEFSIPLVDGAAFAESLALEIGYRYSDYSTSGGESTYKAMVDWSVTDDIKFRAGYNRSVRAPNVEELFASQSLGLWGGVDPCAGDTPALSAAQCANTGVTADQYGNIAASPASQYNALYGGNPDLNPEIADTVTLGVVANLTDDINVTVDYFNIELDQAISSIDPELTVEQCGVTGDAAFCDNVTRNSAGSLWVGQQGFVQATDINLGGIHFEGVDLSANYSTDFQGGQLSANFIGTYMLTKEFDPGIAGTAYDCVDTINTQCFAQPEWRHNVKVSFQSDSIWAVTANWRYFGQVSYDGTSDTLLVEDGGIDAQSYFDIKGAFEINEYTAVLVGVNNVFDKEPPMVGGSLSSNANTVAGFYDTLGRYLHASVTFKF